MTLAGIEFGGGVLTTGLRTFACLLIGAACVYFTFHHRAGRRKLALSQPVHVARRTTLAKQGLTELTVGRDDRDTDIDVIAIHGLDTASPETWTWKDQNDPNNEERWVNWLESPMLPDHIDRIRVFTFNWPADLFESSTNVPKSLDQYATRLLNGIQQGLHNRGAGTGRRPILFIASCLGGVVLMKALLIANRDASEYQDIRNATQGIVFLATPFRGTSFENVASWAVPSLKAWAWVKNQKVTKLLDSVKGPTDDLGEIVQEFTSLCQDTHEPCKVFTFYEGKKTRLLSRNVPWLSKCFGEEKLVSVTEPEDFVMLEQNLHGATSLLTRPLRHWT